MNTTKPGTHRASAHQRIDNASGQTIWTFQLRNPAHKFDPTRVVRFTLDDDGLFKTAADRELFAASIAAGRDVEFFNLSTAALLAWLKATAFAIVDGEDDARKAEALGNRIDTFLAAGEAAR